MSSSATNVSNERPTFASQLQSNEVYRIVPTKPEEIKQEVSVPQLGEEDGEELSGMWSALQKCREMYDQIREHLQDMACDIMQTLTVDDLLEILYPDIYEQLQEYSKE